MDFLFSIAILVLGYFYPAYKCFKAIDSDKLKSEQLHVWCQYWIIIAVFTGFERVADTFISWLPFYSGAKLAFVVYLWHPDTKGTEYIYQTFVKPYLSKRIESLDLNFDLVRDETMRVVTILWNNFLYYTRSKVTGVLHPDVLPPPNTASKLVQQQQLLFPGYQQPLVTQSAIWPREQYQWQRQASTYPLRPPVDLPPKPHVLPTQRSSHHMLPPQPAPKSSTLLTTVVTKSSMYSRMDDKKHHEAKEDTDFEMVQSSEFPIPNAPDVDKRNTPARGMRSRWLWW